MKFLVTILAVTMVSITNVVTAQNNQIITVTAVNATSDVGQIGFALYNKESFLKIPIQAKFGKIVNGKSTVTFKNVPSGEYAISCYHDKNSNNKLDFESNGMPKEDYGFSNNSMKFGPPNYDDAKFMVKNKNVTLDIKF
ncbi:MAG: DUF2141 domain-containing protein [Polaribacter sp.]